MYMNETTYAVYWSVLDTPKRRTFFELTAALKFTEEMRKSAVEDRTIKFITMVGENTNRVGRDGVDEVKDGKTPDGIEYSWVKRRDGGQ